MVYFPTKKLNVDIFWRASKWKILVYYSMPIWNILRPFGTSLNGHLVIMWSFGKFSPILVNCIKKNLATLQLWKRNLRLIFNKPRRCQQGDQIFHGKSPRMCPGHYNLNFFYIISSFKK
jgi:hypothetical protein